MSTVYDVNNLAYLASKVATPPQYFLDNFFTDSHPIEGDVATIDFVVGDQSMPAFVHPNGPASNVALEGYQTDSFRLPLLKPMVTLSPEDAEIRLPGEVPYNSGLTKADRLIQKAADEIKRLKDQIARRKEWMAVKALVSGEIPVVGEGVNYTLSFGDINLVDSATANKKWGTDNGDPLADFGTASALIRENGYVAPNVAMMNSATYAKMLDSKKFKEQVALINSQLALLSGNTNTGYVSVLGGGYIAKEGLDIIRYDGTYKDDATGVLTKMIPDGYVVVATKGIGYPIFYGELTIINSETKEPISIVGEELVDSWVQKNPDRRFLAVMSKPLPAPALLKSWAVIKAY